MADRRALCPDSDQTVPHFIDTPGARRCAQHAVQRDLWADAKSARKQRGAPPPPWIPDPVPPAVRDAAAKYLSTQNSQKALESAITLEQTATNLAAHARNMPAQVGKPLTVMANDLMQQAAALRRLAHQLGADNRLARRKPT